MTFERMPGVSPNTRRRLANMAPPRGRSDLLGSHSALVVNHLATRQMRRRPVAKIRRSARTSCRAGFRKVKSLPAILGVTGRWRHATGGPSMRFACWRMKAAYHLPPALMRRSNVRVDGHEAEMETVPARPLEVVQ